MPRAVENTWVWLRQIFLLFWDESQCVPCPRRVAIYQLYICRLSYMLLIVLILYLYTSMLAFTVATLANFSASSFPLTQTWLGSQINVTFFTIFTNKTISVRRFGLQELLPDAIACKELYESLNMQIPSVLITEKRANLIAVSSAANIVTLGHFIFP